MSRQHYQKGQIWEHLAQRLLLCLLTTIAVVLFLPHDNRVEYKYSKGQPWLQNTLISELQFDILKTDSAIKVKEDSVLARFQPYYTYSVAVREHSLRRFTQKYSDGMPGLSREYASIVVRRLRQAYETGIVSAETGKQGEMDSLAHIRVIKGNTATSMPVNHFLTPKSAYEWLFQDANLQKQRQALQHCNLNEYLLPNVLYDSERTDQEKSVMLSGIEKLAKRVMKGEKIIDRGEVVDDAKAEMIASYVTALNNREVSSTELLATYVGQFLFVFSVILIYTLYLVLYRGDYFDKVRSYAMLYALITVLPVMVSQTVQYHLFSVYLLPLCMAPMLVRIFMDSRTAFMTHCVIVLLSALAVYRQFEFVVIELVGGLVAIYTLRELTDRAQVFTAAFTVKFAQSILFTALQLIPAATFSAVDISFYRDMVASAVLLLLIYPLMFLVEKTFGFTSAVTLFELSNSNKGLLRRLSEVAPGTMQHSITVSNLAAEIANRIGARALEVRVGALYHDIGKMRHPVFFTENQAGINPHTRISEMDSAKVVISHVIEGRNLAERENLPSLIQDFISTHHGAGLTRYFYVQHKNNHPDEEIDDSKFRYPGPNPFTREQAILMMADAVEAASRSLPEYTEETISALVNRLIDGQVSEGYFHDCPITFRDIQTAKEVLIERLKSIYHTRIAYPELKPKAEG